MFSPDFPGSPVVGGLPANAGDIGSIPVWEDSMWLRATKLCATSTEAHGP